MTMTMTDPMALVGFMAFDCDGEELGEVDGIYLGDDAPAWAAVRLTSGTFVVVPLAEADVYEDSLDLPFSAHQVLAAPLQQAELLEDLTEDQEIQLAGYFSGADTSATESVKDRATDVAATAKEQGQEVASTAVEQGRAVAATARDQGQRVASTATAQGQQVLRATTDQAGALVATAKEQAAEVADQASVEVRHLLSETRAQLEAQTAAGAQRLGQQLERLGEEALALAEGRPDEAPTLQGYAKRAAGTLLDAADRAYGVSEDVEARGIGAVLADVQTFARRRPGVFLLGTAALGLVAGRAVRAHQSDARDAEDRPAPRATVTSRRGR